MQDYYNTKYKELTYSERQCIERWHNKDNFSNRRIANLLNKAPQTINNEIKLGLVQLKTKTKYLAKLAQERHEANKQQCGRRSKLTAELNQSIMDGVRDKQSLEVILQGFLGAVCLKTLYNWVEKGFLDVKYHELIYPHYKKAKKLRKTNPKRPYGLSIEERPEEINNRSVFGHWEIDTVILTKTKNACLLTLTERVTRLEIIRLIPDKSALSVNTALCELQKDFYFKSITSDNGREFAKLSEAVACPVYYCHAYASFERGTNENHNRMIRRFLPKGTTKTTSDEVARIETWMNHYPRKMFKYQTPLQMLQGG
ncbi:IS30 family transposase [Lactococcus sp. dk322]|nr:MULTISPECIES: IS30 family transposase [unclassified Lactococcus]MQW23445.1 IS30 family transposase [Lactococcus sp. dk101]TXK37043.1 IS30 family transposase [Lactococcus sp. dk310]TXK37275.1 IS30 family transposase [Lactococcus sp. dk310]TXK46071.1 IS30 family transposase [Lactococcus sp. dk322]